MNALLASQLAGSAITPAGRTIAAKVERLLAEGLPPRDALAVAAELGIEQARAEGAEMAGVAWRKILDEVKELQG